MSGMSSSDRAYAEALRATNIAQKIQKGMLQFADGVIVVCCGDGDQFCDRIDYLRRLLRELGCPERPHFITRHGGALRLVEDSPLNKPGRTTAADLLDEIAEAMDLKKIYTILLEAHCACGKCYHHKLPLSQVVTDLCRARMIVSDTFENAITTKVLNLNWGTERNLFKLSRTEFERNRHMLPFFQMKYEHPELVTITGTTAAQQ